MNILGNTLSVNQSTNQPSIQPAGQPASQPANQPVNQPTNQKPIIYPKGSVVYKKDETKPRNGEKLKIENGKNILK